MVMVGAMPGKVMWRICWNRPAPSMVAASYSSGSIADRAAR